MEKKIVIYYNDKQEGTLNEPLSMEEGNLLIFIRTMAHSDAYQLRHIIYSLERKLNVHIEVEDMGEAKGLNYPIADKAYPGEQMAKQQMYGGPASNKFDGGYQNKR